MKRRQELDRMDSDRVIVPPSADLTTTHGAPEPAETCLFARLPIELLVEIIAASQNFMYAAHTCRTFRAATTAVKIPTGKPHFRELYLWKLAAATSADEIDAVDEERNFRVCANPITRQMANLTSRTYYLTTRKYSEIYLALHIPFLKREFKTAQRARTVSRLSPEGTAATGPPGNTATTTDGETADAKLLQIERIALRNLFHGPEPLSQSLPFLHTLTLARLALYTVEPFSAQITMYIECRRDWRNLPDEYVLGMWYSCRVTARSLVERARLLAAEVGREIERIEGDKEAVARLVAGKPVAMSALLKWARVAIASSTCMTAKKSKVRAFLLKELQGLYGDNSVNAQPGIRSVFKKVREVYMRDGRYRLRDSRHLAFDQFDGEFHHEIVPEKVGAAEVPAHRVTHFVRFIRASEEGGAAAAGDIPQGP